MAKMNIIFMGAPAVGKGTQAESIAQKYDLRHISTGDLLREAANNNSPLGIESQKYMNQGLLVPDGIMIDLVEDVLRGGDFTGFILDGFPRTVPQAQALHRMLQNHQIKLHGVVMLTLHEEELIQRVTGRRIAVKSGRVYHKDFRPPKKEGICDETGEKLIQREDDKEGVVRARLREYWSQQKSLIEYYQDQGILSEISASGNVKEVRERLEDWLKKV